MTKRVGFSLQASVLLGAALLMFAGCGGDTAGGATGTGGGAGSGGTGAGAGGAAGGGAGTDIDGGGIDGAVSPPSSLAAYTLSYRSQVRVPSSGAVMSYADFVAQVSRLDPLAAKRCPVSNDAQFQAAVDALEDATEEIWDQRTAPEFKWDN